jgi:transposase
MTAPEDVVVGIEVAKAALDVAVRPSGDVRQLGNAAEGIAAVVQWLQLVHPQLIVLEATGG